MSADPCPVAMRGTVPSLDTPFTADDRIDASIRFLKHLRHRQGIFATDRCRAPVPALDAVQVAEMAILAARALALDAEAAQQMRGQRSMRDDADA